MPDSHELLISLKLTPPQQTAAAERQKNVIVTAGAGSGKTRTLVGRYLALLAEGRPPRRVAAITFTEKAAREMRSRVRAALIQQMQMAPNPAAKLRWSGIEAQMDSARIGTIHSLCAEILRAHPVEAGIDPRFDVLDESLAATLGAQAISDTLDWLVEEPGLVVLLENISLDRLKSLLEFLLEHRLEARSAFAAQADPQAALMEALRTNLHRTEVVLSVAGLRDLQSAGSLLSDAGDKLAEKVENFLANWTLGEQALTENQPVRAAAQFFRARRALTGGAGKKNSQAKELAGQAKTAYDMHFDPLLGGAESRDNEPDETAETAFAESIPLVNVIFDHLLDAYQTALRQRQALDFDDLEAGAASLLTQPELRRRWQDELDAVLVDEFQDTNARQNQIIMSLCGSEPGRLFVVGDPRQSIYRFRQADVTVFKNLSESARPDETLPIALDRTYRSHEPLLDAMGDLLAQVMGDKPDPERPFFIPYTPLTSDHAEPRQGIQPPYLEFVLGGGPDSETARPAAARALASRLLELRAAGQILRWDDVTLLFRASSGFPACEKALEDAGIPFITVAGQGFYNRPEVRDLLNLLRALADPWDDLAMAGLLRSPAFGLSDAVLYKLRWQNGERSAYYTALKNIGDRLTGQDFMLAQRALEIINELKQDIDRLPVAEVLKHLVDKTYYRAILAAAGSGSRLWRNLDKLLADAQTSGLVNVRAFLAYMDTLRDVGVREGEAPSDAEGAVRLMTIHKAKGLEFPVVVLADAARKRPPSRDAACFLPGLSAPVLTYDLNQREYKPLLLRLARQIDNQQAEAEDKRLLYVAMTRAKEKLIINGHCTGSTDAGWKSDGWLDALLTAGGTPDLTTIFTNEAVEITSPDGHLLRVWGQASTPDLRQGPIAPSTGPGEDWQFTKELALLQGVPKPSPDSQDDPANPQSQTLDDEPEIPSYTWRAVSRQRHPPADALGDLVHRAIQRWVFPGNPNLIQILNVAGRSMGISDPEQFEEAIHLTERLLNRLRQHPIWTEIDQASPRWHEIPFTCQVESGSTLTGIMDLIYFNQGVWQVIDFKTDSIRSPEKRAAAINFHRAQMSRYAAAARQLLTGPVRVRLCFLDDEGRVSLEEI